jgi:hypothetical protein
MLLRTLQRSASAAAICALAGAVRAQVAPGLYELLPPPGAPVFNLVVTGVSADGRWAIGYHSSFPTRVGVRWPLTGPNAFVAQPLHNPAGWSNITPTAISGDGGTVFGAGRAPGQSFGTAFKWTAAGFTSLGTAGTPRDCSSSGGLVLIDNDSDAGSLWNAATSSVVRWMPQGFTPSGMDALGGNIVGGRSAYPYLAARETSGGGIEELCSLVGCGTSNSYTRPSSSAMSADGSTWAGVIRQVGTGYGGYDASLFFYRNGVLTTVPNACGVASEPELAAVSANGDVAVGTMFFCGPTSYTAFYYEPASGMRSLHDVLTSSGVNVSGWDSLNVAHGVSANGSVVIGSGERPGPVYNVPFVAVVPLPCDPIDFNGDALFPDVQDIADFLSVFAGGVCAGQQPGDTPCNSDIDFNNDSLLPDAADIGSLIRVFGGGPC